MLLSPDHMCGYKDYLLIMNAVSTEKVHQKHCNFAAVEKKMMIMEKLEEFSRRAVLSGKYSFPPQRNSK